MNNPIVTYIAVSYNHQNYLRETLNSIILQDHFNECELIVWDDGSKDESRQEISNWKKENDSINNVNLFLNSENIGLCPTLNKCIEIAKGTWIKMIACDDVLELNYFTEFYKQVRAHQNASFFCSDISITDSNSKTTIKSNWNYSNIKPTHEYINEFKNLLNAQYLHAPSMCFKKDLWKTIGGFDSSLSYEDWDFLLRAKKDHEFCFSEKQLVKYRVHSHNMHHEIETNEKYIKDTIDLLLKHYTEEYSTLISDKLIDNISKLLIINENLALEIWEKVLSKLKIITTDNPLISVLFPVYNSEKYLENSLKTLLLQSYKNFEIIAIDDNSTDSSSSILEKYSNLDLRIKVVKKDSNLGLIKTLNHGLTFCKGQYIMRMDSDDLIVPNRIDLLVSEIISEKYDAVSSWMINFYNKNKFETIRFKKYIEELKIISFFYIPISHAATMFKSEVINNLKYNEDFKYVEDYELWIRFFKNKYKIKMIEKPLYFYRQHENQVTKSSHKLEGLKKISEKLFDWWGIEKNKIDLENHALLFLNQESKLENKEQFLNWDKILNKALKAINKKRLFDRSLFIDIIFNNYWLTKYNFFKYDFTFFEKIKLCFSHINPQSTAKKLVKVFIKK